MQDLPTHPVATSTPSTSPQPFSHLDDSGAAHMVDITDKPVSRREAVATGFIHLQPATLQLLQDQALPKGDVLAAWIAAIRAVANTSPLGSAWSCSNCSVAGCR